MTVISKIVIVRNNNNLVKTVIKKMVVITQINVKDQSSKKMTVIVK
jgi:hypothetical protein